MTSTEPITSGLPSRSVNRFGYFLNRAKNCFHVRGRSLIRSVR